jgi:surface protein
MFYGTQSFNQPLNGWDVSKVTNMKRMFLGAIKFNQPLNEWKDKLGEVTDMREMFYWSAFDGKVDGWQLGKVTDMSNMFRQAKAFNQPLNEWIFGQVKNMSGMFDGRQTLTNHWINGM